MYVKFFFLLIEVVNYNNVKLPSIKNDEKCLRDSIFEVFFLFIPCAILKTKVKENDENVKN